MPTVKHLVHMDSKDSGHHSIGHLVHTDSIESTRSKMSLKTAYQVIDLARKLDKGAIKGCGGLTTSSIHNQTTRSSIFANFETCRLRTEERVYLHAARLGECGVICDMISDDNVKFDVNCVDYMGRNALFLAVDSESVETIENLMEIVSWECIEEALLHAIGMGSRDLVRIMVDHPAYILKEKNMIQEAGYTDPFFRTEEKYQFPPDVTPLILAAQKNDHELIQLFLSKGCTIHKPHAIDCQCSDCLVKQTTDSLKRSRSRMNAYRALASPSYMALSNPDPITATFELRQEMKKVSHVEKEFQGEYLALVEQCMDFACELMDLCRGTQEVEAVLGEDVSLHRDPLARLRLAIEYGEKKFVAHPNCQQHLTNIWYGKEMGFFQTLPLYKKIGIVLIVGPLLPLICVSYIIHPRTAIARKLKCPVTKFITHTLSHFVFLFLLGLATFGLEAIFYGAKEMDLHSEQMHMDQQIFSRKVFSKIRPMRTPFTIVQYLIIFWIIGLLWIECKQIYHSGAREHFMQYYNFMDFSILALYMASYSLRLVAQYHVINANHYFNATSRATLAIKNQDWSIVQNLLDEANSQKNQPFGYFIHASRFQWSPKDPEIVSEILFAIANVMSFARTTYVMPSHEMLGPLQISLGRMFGDIARFIVLFVLVLMAFMVGMTNLYRYYGSHISEITNEAASQTFRGLPETVHTLFFSIFGLISLDKLRIRTPSDETSQVSEKIYSVSQNLSLHKHGAFFDDYDASESTALVDQVGLILFAIYLIVVTIVLVNILIAMMSHSFDDIQGDSDMEWKFARTKLWLNYIDECSTMPVPFNMIPSPKSMMSAIVFLKDLFLHKEDLSKVKYNFHRRREYMYTPDPEAMKSLLQRSSTYSEIIQRLVRRYLFKLERERKGGDGDRILVAAEDFVEDIEEDEDEISKDENTISCDDDVSTMSNNLKPISEDYIEDGVVELEVPIKNVTQNGSGNLENDALEKAQEVFASSPRRSNSRKRASIATVTGNHTTAPSQGIHRSRSAEALRQLTRRATIKRVGTKRGSGRMRKFQNVSDHQLDAIQRSQKLLDARLQDLQAYQMTKIEDSFIKENIVHMRQLISEHQKAMGCMVRAIDSMQEELRNVVGYVTSSKGRRATTGSILTRARESKSMKLQLRKKRSDPTNM